MTGNRLQVLANSLNEKQVRLFFPILLWNLLNRPRTFPAYLQNNIPVKKLLEVYVFKNNKEP